VPKRVTQKSHPRGCLICNTGIELGSRDPEIRDFVKGVFRDFANVIKQCLERAVEKGQLQKSTDLASLATYLVNEFRTSLLLARSGHSRREIQRHLEVALQVLR
jgi:TetR/AcrR family transcriptional repressor of nem operon